VLAYLRTYKGKSVVVALNMTASAQKPSLKLPSSSANLKTLLATQGVSSKGMEVSLPPLGVLIAEVQ
jgi:hypothetical protein